jgi:hypothetical protein
MNSSQRSASKKKENVNEIGAFPHFWVKEVELRLKNTQRTLWQSRPKSDLRYELRDRPLFMTIV